MSPRRNLEPPLPRRRTPPSPNRFRVVLVESSGERRELGETKTSFPCAVGDVVPLSFSWPDGGGTLIANARVLERHEAEPPLTATLVVERTRDDVLVGGEPMRLLLSLPRGGR